MLKIRNLKNLIFSALLLIGSYAAHSQSPILSFCTFVNSQTQECVFDNTKFITTPDSTHAKIFMMFRSPDAVGGTHLIYKVYSIDRFGKEVTNQELTQDVQPEWLTTWQPVVVTSPGKYMVKVYKDAEHMLVSKGFELFNN